jgi:transcriptional regulatory protein RtcR
LLIDRFELFYEKSELRLAEEVSNDIATVSPETKVHLHEFAVRDPWDFEEVYATLHEFARSYAFRPDREEYVIHITTGTHVVQICLFLLAESRHMPGRLLQASPPRRGQTIEGSYRIIDLDLSRYDALAARFALEQQEGLLFLKSGIDTRNARFNALIERIEKVAINSKAPILLTGPTGAGKSQLARRIYELKKQRRQIEGKFVEVNCATLRGDQAMSALFGHEKGAFTGARSAREGLLRAAHGGIVFLDEIGELGVTSRRCCFEPLKRSGFFPSGRTKKRTANFN